MPATPKAVADAGQSPLSRQQPTEGRLKLKQFTQLLAEAAPAIRARPTTTARNPPKTPQRCAIRRRHAVSAAYKPYEHLRHSKWVLWPLRRHKARQRPDNNSATAFHPLVTGAIPHTDTGYPPKAQPCPMAYGSKTATPPARRYPPRFCDPVHGQTASITEGCWYAFRILRGTMDEMPETLSWTSTEDEVIAANDQPDRDHDSVMARLNRAIAHPSVAPPHAGR